MDIKLLNEIIKDIPNKSTISDGTFTLGELHKDRLSLYINWIDLLAVIYDAKGVPDIIWVAPKDSAGETTEGFFHLGLFAKDKNLVVGALVPMDLWESYQSRAKTLIQAPRYRSLVETLPNYFYERLSKPEII